MKSEKNRRGEKNVSAMVNIFIFTDNLSSFPCSETIRISLFYIVYEMNAELVASLRMGFYRKGESIQTGLFGTVCLQ